MATPEYMEGTCSLCGFLGFLSNRQWNTACAPPKYPMLGPHKDLPLPGITMATEQKGAPYLLRIRNAKQLVCICSSGERFKKQKAMSDVAIIANGALVVGHDGLIVAVGKEEAIEQEYGSKPASFVTILDATDKVVLPGLVDGHTHPVWSGDRCHEFAMKLAGASYMDVHKMGGGIGFTVKHVHESSQEELEKLLRRRMDRMLRFGTTLIEAKSGYGLDLTNEAKMLRVLHNVNKTHPIDIVSNFCGAHSVPKGMTAAQATEDVINKQIPGIKQLRDAGEVSAELIDVFCEKGVFEREDSKRILECGKKHGFAINFHGDELHPTGSAELAAELGATAVSHLEHISDAGVKALADANVVGVLLPTTAYVLRIERPPARKMIENGVIVALGSDFNPNAHCLSMPFVMNLSCISMHMTMPEVLNAATINAAASVNRSQTHGSLEAGKHADFILLDAPTWEHIVYDFVDPPIEAVYKKGRSVFSRETVVQ